MNKADLRVLEKAFDAEIRGAILQGKSKRIDKLVADGYLSEATRTFGSRLGAIVCKGYELTHAGRLTYCMTCGEPDEDGA